ncbi:acetyl-CoA synthetase-like protein [Hyaloscypha variabilis F]|uniref:Acetyl-CoA synthetase-like protein n=1 Tax=Hyaloscypha variabilis (strain UAMH 11265 / GT02V1 / F) TaxID=1149755 RepID=A0A2J6R7J5_HYAVF|nr:acetyl-CoA synthetase-like protein [Hyaloscypha variabilis F]
MQRLSIVQGPSHPPLMKITLGELTRRQSRKHGDRVAVIAQHQNEEITYSQLHKHSDDLAAGMVAMGTKRGDRVAVMLGNRSEYVYLLVACSKIGAIITLLNYAYSHTEILAALSTTRPKLFFTTLGTSKYDYRPCLSKLEQRIIPSLNMVVLLQDVDGIYLPGQSSPFFERFESLLETGRRQNINWKTFENRIQDTDILNLQFTSGSTGAPKAAALTHHGMLNCARYIGMKMDIRETDNVVIPVPLFHAFGLIIGAATVLPSEYFDAALTLKAVQRYRCTGLYGVTTMFIDQLSHPDFTHTNRTSLRFGLMAGSAMPEDLLLRVINKFPIKHIYTNWGMTELSSIATMTSASDPISKKQKTAGKILPNLTAKIVVPNTGTVLPWGARGEIVVSGFSVMHSYFEDDERTMGSIKHHPEDFEIMELKQQHGAAPRRWMHTGDEGYLDEDGYLVVTGRIKDLIIRGGENIAPLEIEERLFEHPAIKQACVFGIPNDRYGEVVAAFLELENGLARPEDEKIREWVRGTLSRYKVPVRIWWLGDVEKGCPVEWPKTANGKLRKKDIREIGTKML